MSIEDIKKTINSFKLGAIRVKKAGFVILELHVAHGCLINIPPSQTKEQICMVVPRKKDIVF